MKRGLLALLLAAGCAPDDGCGDVSQWLTEPAELAVAGSYAFAAVAWHPIDAGCFGSRTRVHAIELGASPGARASKKVPGSILGEAASTGDAVWFASGADEEIFRVGAAPPFEVERLGVSSVPVHAAATGGRAFFPIFDAGQVFATPPGGTGDGEAIPVTEPIDAVAGDGRIYTSSTQGDVTEIDAASTSALRTIPSCASLGPIALTSGGTIVVSCAGGGVGVLDLATEDFSVDEPSLTVTALSGGATGALFSVDGAADRYTQVFVPGVGGVGEQLQGWLVDDAVFDGDHAFASIDGTPWRVALSGSGSTILTGFASDAGARIAAGSAGEILVLEGGSGAGARLHRRDAATGDAIDVIELPDP